MESMGWKLFKHWSAVIIGSTIAFIIIAIFLIISFFSWIDIWAKTELPTKISNIGFLSKVWKWLAIK